MFDAFKVGEKWTTVIPSTIDVDFFDSALSKFNTFLCDTIVPICLFCVTLIAAVFGPASCNLHKLHLVSFICAV